MEIGLNFCTVTCCNQSVTKEMEDLFRLNIKPSFCRIMVGCSEHTDRVGFPFRLSR